MAPWPSGLEERSGSQGSRVRIPAVLFSRVLARTNQLVSGLSRPDGTIALRKRARTKGRNAKEHSGQCRTAKNRFAPKRGDRGNGEREHGFRSPGERRPEFRACRVHPIGVRTPGRREKSSRQAEQSESAWWLSESSDYGAPHPAKDRTADKRIPAPRRKEDRLAKSRRAHKRSKGRIGEGRKEVSANTRSPRRRSPPPRNPKPRKADVRVANTTRVPRSGSQCSHWFVRSSAHLVRTTGRRTDHSETLPTFAPTASLLLAPAGST